jgi:hypothetical protein
VFERLPTSEEVKHAAKFIKAEKGLLASAAPDQVVERSSTPESKIRPTESTNSPVELASSSAIPTASPAAPDPAPAASPPSASVATNSAANTNAMNVAAAGDGGGNFGGNGGGFRGGGFRQRIFKGPGSASDVVVGRLAPGIARPKVFHQALPEKPATPEEGAMALFTQALFGSAEFRYLQ